MLLSAIGDWSLDPRQCLLLGDADRDVEAAKAAGVRGYRYGGGDLADFLRPLLNV
jgi:D-glycero-D-manno-heptose 1,7-bisphosphate phosphatase